MESNTIAEILRATIGSSGTSTRYSRLDESSKRQVAVAAVLELYKADSLGGKESVYSNLQFLEPHVTEILKAMDLNNK